MKVQSEPGGLSLPEPAGPALYGRGINATVII